MVFLEKTLTARGIDVFSRGLDFYKLAVDLAKFAVSKTDLERALNSFEKMEYPEGNRL